MSSVTSCYTPLKMNKPQDHDRRDSFEIGVFQASSYYSSVTEAALTHANNVECVQEDEKYGLQKPNKNTKHRPSSPGAKVATYLHSLFNQTPLSKSKRKPMLFKDEGSRSRSSSMSLARWAETASVYSCASYSRPTPALAHTRAYAKPAHRDLRSCSSYNRTHSLEAGGGWPALRWFDQELKTRKGVSYHVKDLNEEDGAQSDSSSDLFELQNYDLRRKGRTACS